MILSPQIDAPAETSSLTPPGGSRPVATDWPLGAQVAICGGGTAGHVMTGVALAQAFRASGPGLDVLCIGGTDGFERKIYGSSKFHFVTVPSGPVAGQGDRRMIRGLGRSAAGVLAACRVFNQVKVVLAIGVGGYASVPGILAARLAGIPTAIVELNAYPGMANRLLGFLVERVYLGPLTLGHGFSRADEVRIGLPVRSDLPSGRPRLAYDPTRSGLVKILVTGGSLGSGFLNRNAPVMLSRLARSGVLLQVTHQSGADTPGDVALTYGEAGIHATVRPYFDDFLARLVESDFVICSPGALTLGELSALGVPCMVVPDPSAAHDHQTANATVFSRLTGCLCSSADRWDSEKVAQAIFERLREPARLRSEVARMRALAPSDAGLRLVQSASSLIRWRG